MPYCLGILAANVSFSAYKISSTTPSTGTKAYTLGKGVALIIHKDGKEIAAKPRSAKHFSSAHLASAR